MAAVQLVHRRVRRPEEAAEAVVVVPRRGLVLGVVEGLAPADHFIAVQHEVLRQRHGQRHGVAPDVAVRVAAGGRRPHAGHQARARWVAGRGLAVGPPEGDAALGERIDVRRERLRVPAEDPDPVVHVVDRNHEDVGARGAGALAGGAAGGYGTQPHAAEPFATGKHVPEMIAPAAGCRGWPLRENGSIRERAFAAFRVRLAARRCLYCLREKPQAGSICRAMDVEVEGKQRGRHFQFIGDLGVELSSAAGIGPDQEFGPRGGARLPGFPCRRIEECA